MNLSRIDIFPIKALDGVSVQQARITKGGILENDRVYAMLDAQGKYINGKRTARVHELRCAFDENITEVRLWQNGQSTAAQFPLADLARLGQWLSEFFGFPVTVKYDAQSGFPDDREAFGPTVGGEASLRALETWYPGIPLENIRCRFRANLELSGPDAPPFAEDRLYGAPGERKPFQIGTVTLLGHNPCQRCVVPTRNPLNGEPAPDFQKTFMRLRQEQLPPWANRERFNHFYRFAVNTSILITESGKRVSVGDNVLVG